MAMLQSAGIPREGGELGRGWLLEGRRLGLSSQFDYKSLIILILAYWFEARADYYILLKANSDFNLNNSAI